MNNKNIKIGAAIAGGIIIVGGVGYASTLGHKTVEKSMNTNGTPNKIEHTTNTNKELHVDKKGAVTVKETKVTTPQKENHTVESLGSSTTIENGINISKATRNIVKSALQEQDKATYQKVLTQIKHEAAVRSQQVVRTSQQIRQEVPSQGVSMYNTPVTGYVNIANVANNYLNVRDGASINDSIIGKTFRGEHLELLGSVGGWYLVKTSQGEVGYVYGEYVSRTQEPVISNTSNTVPTTHNKVNVVPVSHSKVSTVPTKHNKVNVVPTHVVKPSVTPTPAVKPAVKPVVKPTPVVKPVVKPTPAVKPVVKPAPVVKPEVKPVVKPVVKPEVKPAVKPEVKPAVKPAVKPEVKPAVKPAVKPEVKPTPVIKPVVKPAVKPTPVVNPAPVVKPAVKPAPVVKPTVKPTPVVKSTPVVKPVVKPAIKPIVKPTPVVKQEGTIRVVIKTTNGQLVGQAQTATGVVGTSDTLSMPSIPSGYKEVSMTVNGVSVAGMPSQFKDGVQDVVIVVAKTTAPVRVVIVDGSKVLNTSNRVMKVGAQLGDNLIPSGLTSHYKINSINVNGQAVGTTISGTVQEGQNVITINVSRKTTPVIIHHDTKKPEPAVKPAPVQTGMSISSQKFHDEVTADFGVLLNQYRASFGHKAVTQGSIAMEAANWKANSMAESGIMSHIAPDGKVTSDQPQWDKSGQPMSKDLLNENVLVTFVNHTDNLTSADAQKLAEQIINIWKSSGAHAGTLASVSYINWGFGFKMSSNGKVYAAFEQQGINMGGVNWN